MPHSLYIVCFYFHERVIGVSFFACSWYVLGCRVVLLIASMLHVHVASRINEDLPSQPTLAWSQVIYVITTFKPVLSICHLTSVPYRR